MKRILRIGAVLAVLLVPLLVPVSRAEARVFVGVHFGPGYYHPRPYGYYGPPPGYDGSRFWVPGHWRYRYDERVWIPGHWVYR